MNPTSSTINEAIRGTGELPPVAGQFSGALLVMGGAACVRDDLLKVANWSGDRMAVNDIGAHFHGTITHWATLHPEYLPGWMKYRLGHNYGNRGHVFTHSDKRQAEVQVCWELASRPGDSGLFACYVGLLLGYSSILLAGVPCDNSPHYFDPLPSYAGSLDNRSTRIDWTWAARNVFAGRVKSLSGRTRDWLGAPRSPQESP